MMLDNLPFGWIVALGVAWCVGYLMGQRSHEPTWKNSATKRMELQQLIDNLPKEGRAAVDEAMKKGHMIEAIKTFRNETSSGLKDAKEAIDLIKATQYKNN